MSSFVLLGLSGNVHFDPSRGMSVWEIEDYSGTKGSYCENPPQTVKATWLICLLATCILDAA